MRRRSTPAPFRGLPVPPRALGWPRLWRRDLGTSPGPMALLAALLTATLGLLLAVPMLTTDTYDAQLRAVLRAAPSLQRDIVVTGTLDGQRLTASGGATRDPGRNVFAQFDHAAAARSLRETLDPKARRLAGDITWSAVTPTGLAGGTREIPEDLIVSVRAQSDLADQVRWVDGRAPKVQGLTGQGLRQLRVRSATLEVAVSSDIADQLRWKVGQLIEVAGNEGGQTRNGGGRGPGSKWMHAVTLRVVGIFQARDASLGPWPETRSALSPVVVNLGYGRYTMLTFLTGPQQYPDLCEAVDHPGDGATGSTAASMEHAWRLAVRDEVTAADIPDLRALPVLATASLDGARLPLANRTNSSNLGPLIDAVQRDEGAAQALLSVLFAGLATISAASLVMLVLGLVARRDRHLRALAARGASVPQLWRLTLLPCLAVTVVAFGLSAAAVRLVWDRWPPGWTLAVALAVALIPMTLLAHQVRSLARAAVRGPAGPMRRATRIRLGIGYALLVTLTVLGVVQLRHRGPMADAAHGIDPYLAAVPVLVALSGAALAVIGYPLVMRSAARGSAAGAGAVGLVGLARASRTGRLIAVPLISLTLGLALTMLAIGMAQTAPRERDAAAVHALGARMRVDGPASDADRARLARLPGVRDVVPVHVSSTPAVAPLPARPVRLIVVDPERYQRVLAEAGVPADLSPITGRPVPPAHDVYGYETPVMISAGTGALGKTFQIDLGVSHLQARAVAESPFLAGGAAQDEVVVVVPAQIAAVVAPEATPESAYVLADAPARSAISSGRSGLPSSWVARDADRQAAAVGSQPLSRYLVDVIIACAALTGLHLVIALVLLLQLTRRPRAEAIARLRTMGLTRRQVLGVTVVEAVPVGLTGCGLGVAFGYLLPVLLDRGLDLSPFTGGRPHPVIHTVWWVPLALTLAALALLLLVVMLDAVRARRRGLAATLRMGDVS